MTKKLNRISIKQWPEGASAIDMGRELIAKLGGLQGVDRAHAEEIMQIKGLGLAKTAQIKAAIEIGKRVRRLDMKPIDLNTFKYVQISKAAEIPGRLTPEIKAILEDAGATLERETT